MSSLTMPRLKRVYWRECTPLANVALKASCGDFVMDTVAASVRHWCAVIRHLDEALLH